MMVMPSPAAERSSKCIVSCRLPAVMASEPRLTGTLVHTVLPGRTADRVECSGGGLSGVLSIFKMENGNHAEVKRTKVSMCCLIGGDRSISIPSMSGRHVAQEVERVIWEPEGCGFDPGILLAECRGVPEQDTSP